MIDIEKKGLEEVRSNLNKKGCGFCLAKWTQVTIHLQTGMTHSCHHPSPHKIPLNEIGKPFIITTGRQLTSNGFPKEVDTAIIMLDGKCAFQSLEQDLYHIWWGAYLGMKSEVIIDGQLSKVADRIIQTRQQERAKHGWIMDSYMLRREKTRKKLGKRTVLHKHEK